MIPRTFLFIICFVVGSALASAFAWSAEHAFADTSSTDTLSTESPSPQTLLEQRLSTVNGVSAAFRQTVTDSYGRVLETSEGSLHLDKPKFRWEVLAPFPQVIVADGTQLQIYDPDLEQLTVQSLSGANRFDVPLSILIQAELALDGLFDVTYSGDTSKERFRLIPLDQESLFAALDFVFQDGYLHAFTILDHSGQQAEVMLVTYQSGLVLQSELFELEVPEGTDIVEG